MASIAPSQFPGPPSPEQEVSVEDWFALPEDMGAELINGRLVYNGTPGAAHRRAQMGLMELIRGPYHRRTSTKEKPGGWWIAVDTDMDIAALGCRPDVLGWRRDKHPTMPAPAIPALVTAVPAWICEIISPTTAYVDMGDKRMGYHRAGVLHYWLADPINGTLTVLQWAAEGYLVALVASRREKVRAAPFAEITLDLGVILGEDDFKEPVSSSRPSLWPPPASMREPDE